MRGRNLFNMASHNKAVKAAVPNAPKKKVVMRDYPLNYNPRIYSTTELRRTTKKEEEKPIDKTSKRETTRNKKLESKIQTKDQTKTKTQTQNVEIKVEEQYFEDENINEEQESFQSETILDKYTKLVELYQKELDRRNELKNTHEDFLHKIHIAYSNQIKLERGIIPSSMQDPPSHTDEEEDFHQEYEEIS